MGPYANLTNAELSGAYLESSNLVRVNLTDADLSGANLTNAYIIFTRLSGTNLTHATLTGNTSFDIEGTPATLPPGWELVNGVLKPTSIPLASHSTPGTTKSSVVAAPRVSAAPKLTASPKLTARPRAAASTPAVTIPQRGIDVYVTDSCESTTVWQSNATNEMRSIKSLGANSVEIVFPFYTTAPNATTVFSADLCGEPEATPVPLQSPSPARLAVLVRAAQLAGLQVLIRPLLDQSNIYIFGDWRGDIAPTSQSAWIMSYESVLKPYLEMAQANRVTRFVISSELNSLSTSSQWPAAIASAHKLFSGQLIFDSSLGQPDTRCPSGNRGRTRRLSARSESDPERTGLHASDGLVHVPRSPPACRRTRPRDVRGGGHRGVRWLLRRSECQSAPR